MHPTGAPLEFVCYQPHLITCNQEDFGQGAYQLRVSLGKDVEIRDDFEVPISVRVYDDNKFTIFMVRLCTKYNNIQKYGTICRIKTLQSNLK